MSTRAHHLYLVAPGADPDAIRRFYRDGIGLPEREKPQSLLSTPVLWFDGGPIAVHVGYPEAGTVSTGHFALETDDLDAARARLLSLGYAMDDDVIPMGYPRFYVHDPWGNSIELLPPGLP